MIDSVCESPFPVMQPGDHMNPVQFYSQASEGSGVFGSPGLAEIQAAYSARVPRFVAPSTSGNGMSSGQYQETLGGAFPADNGMAAQQYETAKFAMQKDV